MEQNMTMVVMPSNEKRHKMNCILDEEYDKLISLAELDYVELSSCKDDNAEYALETVMEHGTYHDAAEAIKHYVNYMHVKNEMYFM